jgi:hypothetical protein
MARKPTGNPNGRPRLDGLPAGSVPPGEDNPSRTTSVSRNTASDIASVLAQLGADSRGEIDVWAKADDGAWEYVDVVPAAGYEMRRFAKQFGPGRYRCDIFAVDASGRRSRKGSSELRIRSGQVPNAALPAALPGADPMVAASASMMAMMGTAMAGMAKAFESLRPAEPITLAQLIPLLRPERGDSSDKVLDLITKGMKIGEQLGGAGDGGGIAGAVQTAMTSPIANALAKRLEAEPVSGPVRQLAPSTAAAPAAVDVTPDLTVPVANISDIGPRIQLLAPMIVVKLRLGKSPPEVAQELVDDVYDLIGAKSPDVWDQLVGFAEDDADSFVELTVAELAPKVPAQMHGQLQLVVRAVREELIKQDPDDDGAGDTSTKGAA